MKYLFFIMLIGVGCREPWRPKPQEIETPKIDSISVVDRDSTRLNFVVFNKEKYYFVGVKSDSTVLKEIGNVKMLDSLIKGAKSDMLIYLETKGSEEEFRELVEALKRNNIFKFRLVSDDKLRELRVEKYIRAIK